MNRQRREPYGLYGTDQRQDPARLILKCLSHQESQRALRRLDEEIEDAPGSASALAIRGLLYQLLGDDCRAE